MKKNAKRIKEKQIAKKKGQIAKQIKTVLFVFTTRPTPFFLGGTDPLLGLASCVSEKTKWSPEVVGAGL